MLLPKLLAILRPQQVLEYVGRYTHRVAIANQRWLDMDDGHGRFRYKNYRAEPPQTPQTMTLDAPEFIRRFLRYVLPTGFHRMRYRRLAGPSPPHGDTRPMPTTPRDDRHAAAHRRNPTTIGLSRPLRVPHRRLVTPLSGLWGRAHDRDPGLAARVPVPKA